MSPSGPHSEASEAAGHQQLTALLPDHIIGPQTLEPLENRASNKPCDPLRKASKTHGSLPGTKPS